MAPVKYDVIQMHGGLDQVTPTLSKKAGVCVNAFNFEVAINGGYTRIAGYERFDGRPSPSAATYIILPVVFSGSTVTGDTVTGVTSGATGVVCAQTATQIVITKVVGTFNAAEVLNVLGSPVATTNGGPAGAFDFKTDATYLGAAAEIYRSDIVMPTGSGAIRGGFHYNSVNYCFRDNAGATACNLWKSTASGWSQITFGKSLAFTAGTAIIADGAAIVGGTSGATATVARVVLETGAWGAAATGQLILTGVTGTFQAAEAIKVGGVSKATASGAQTQITLLPGGHYETCISNFGGATNTLKVYGCDGINKGWEFDGTTFLQINSTMSPDTPNFVVAHKNYLFYAFGASVQFSAVGFPYAWSPILGAGEIGMGDTVSGFLIQPGTSAGSTLAIYTHTNTYMLYGSTFGGGGDAKLTPYNTGTGARPYTAQNMLNSYVLDERGVIALATSLNYGNFESSTLTHLMWPFIREHGSLAIASVVSREKSQYRVFFSDGYGLFLTIVNNEVVGCMPVLFPDSVTCCWNDTDSTGKEFIWFGSAGGHVMQMETGTSFDGVAIQAYLQTAFNASGSPRLLKRYRKASFEVEGNGYSEFTFGYDLGYQSPNITAASDVTYANNLAASAWDSFTWDFFTWDGVLLAPAECEMLGTAENCALRILSNSALWQSFTLNSAVIHYSPRRGLR